MKKERSINAGFSNVDTLSILLRSYTHATQIIQGLIKIEIVRITKDAVKIKNKIKE